MLLSQQVVHRLNRIECSQGYFYKDRVPIAHRTVPKSGKFQGFQVFTVLRLIGNKACCLIHILHQVEFDLYNRVRHKPNLPIEVRTLFKHIFLFSGSFMSICELFRGICREIVPSLLYARNGPPPGSPTFFTIPQTRISSGSAFFQVNHQFGIIFEVLCVSRFFMQNSFFCSKLVWMSRICSCVYLPLSSSCR